jgi:hypothetical protein
MKLKLVACEVLYRELCALIARSPHQVDFAVRQRTHDIGAEGMLACLQAAVDAADTPGYESCSWLRLCNNGISGPRATLLSSYPAAMIA